MGWIKGLAWKAFYWKINFQGLIINCDPWMVWAWRKILRITVYYLSYSNFCSFFLCFFLCLSVSVFLSLFVSFSLSFFSCTYFLGQRVVPETSFISHFPGPRLLFRVIFFPHPDLIIVEIVNNGYEQWMIQLYTMIKYSTFDWHDAGCWTYTAKSWLVITDSWSLR